MLDKLGKHRTGQICLYINKLADVDLKILEKIVASAYNKVKHKNEIKQQILSDTEQQIATFLDSFNSEIASLTQQLREYLRKETKPTTELVGDSTISLNIGYGFTEKAWDCYCAIIVYSKHINISFPSICCYFNSTSNKPTNV